MECDVCDFTAKSPRGLAMHRRAKHAGTDAGPNETAVNTTLAELDRLGRLERTDTARVQGLRSMARALDLDPFNSQMWREYRTALEGITADDDSDTPVDDLIAELSSPVRDS